MCNKTCIDFGVKYLTELDIRDKKIIEVGATNVNGSLRNYLLSQNPKSYIGTDMSPGPGVDEICKVEELIVRYGENTFDVLISTEMLEHVKNWRTAISNLKGVIKPGGLILLTTRSKGAGYHGFPFDYWRFELSDMEKIFADFQIEALISDSMSPGVLIKAKKKEPFVETDYRGIALYNILAKKPLLTDPWVRISIVQFFSLVRPLLSKILPRYIKKLLKNVLNKSVQNR